MGIKIERIEKQPVIGSVGIKEIPPISGSVGIKEIPPITGTVSVTGSVGIKEMAGVSGSVGIKELPSITGSVDIRGGTIDITGSVGIKEMAGVTGSIDVRTGSIQAHIIGGSVDTTITAIERIGSIAHVLSGSIGIIEGGGVGTVTIRTGSIQVHGSVGIKEMAGVSGSVGIKELPSITGTVDIRGGEISIASGTVEVSSLPSITGSVDIRELPSITGSVDIRGGTIDITGSVGIKEMAGVTGSIDIKGNAYGSATIWSAQNIGAGSTLTGAWQDVEGYRAKTFGVKLKEQSGSVSIDVSFIGTAAGEYQEYYSERTAPGSFAALGFDVSCKYTRIKVTCSTSGAGTIDAWFGKNAI